MADLYVPDVTGLDMPSAALAYTEAGWYVLPVDPAGKHPGSRVGMGWPDKSTRAPETVRGWFAARPGDALALHTGRSGAVAFDVDNPAELPEVLCAAFAAHQPAVQSTRTNNPERGHYVFAAEPGRFGCSLGDLPRGWGEVRSGNSVIVVEPTVHSKAEHGGRYVWLRGGALPELPSELAACLRPPGGGSRSAAMGDVDALLAELDGGQPCPAVAAVPVDFPGERHNEMVPRTLRLVRLGEQGHRGVPGALETLRDEYVAAVDAAGTATDSEAEADYDRALMGALAVVREQPTPEVDRGCCGEAAPAPRREKLPPPSTPLSVARTVAASYRTDAGHLTLQRWRGSWIRWYQTNWAEAEAETIEKTLYERLEHATYEKDGKPVPWAPNRRRIGDVLDALGAVTLLPGDNDAPGWLDPAAAQGFRGAVVACANGLLDTATRELRPHDPRFFNLVSVPFAYDPAAPEPARWLAFLRALWPDDPDSIAALAQWFGYVLSGRTHLQKILMIQGPRRSGKGTIARVLQALVGKGNHAGPTLASLGQNFGLQPLIGVPLAVVSDARLKRDRDTVSVIVERLLSISGEDAITVDRKYRAPWTGRLPTRFMILTNELPAFGDASGAIVTRFVVLTQSESWLGREDTGLGDALIAELPGILNWALDGLAALDSAGRLTEPDSSAEAVTTMADAASPLSAFVRERCRVAPGLECAPEQLYAAWRGWCQTNGRDHPGTVQTFARDLRSVVPSMRTTRPYRDGARVRVLQGIALAAPEDTAPAGGGGPRWSADIPIVSSTGRNPHEHRGSRDNNRVDRGPSRTIAPAPEDTASSRRPACTHGCVTEVPWKMCNPRAGVCTTCGNPH